MLSLDWYKEAPIDFEHKNYLLLDYLSKIDTSYSQLKLSPYLLWTEKLVQELEQFKINIQMFESSLKKELVGITLFGLKWKEIERTDELKEIYEIVDYSKPILEVKIKIGYKLFNKYPQILY